MNTFLNYFYIIDIFKTPLTLLFEKKRFISTKFGVLCSLGIFSIIIIMTINSDLFEKSLPQIISRTLPLTQRPLHILNRTILAIGVQDDEYFKGFIDATYYTVKLKNFIYTVDSSGGYEHRIIEKEFHACSEADFDDPSKFKELGLANNLCLKKEENTIQVEGFYDEPDMQFANIYLYLCENSTSNNTCKSYEEMKEKLNGMTFNIYFQDTVMDAQNHQDPIKRTIVNRYTYIDIDFYKNLELYFQDVSLVSDEGWLFTDAKTFDEIGFASQTSDFFSVDAWDVEKPRCCFQLYSGRNTQKFSRQYLKISDLLAKLGGIMQGLILICYIFVHIEQSLFLKNRVLNSLYVFQTEPANKTKKTKFNLPLSLVKPVYLTKVNEEPPSVSMQVSKHLQINNESMKTNKNIMNENHARRKNWVIFSFFGQTRKILDFQSLKNKTANAQHLNFGIFKYFILKIKGCFPCLKIRYEEELFKKSEKVYEKELDFIEILKKLQEFEKLKKILLNPKQLVLFNFLAKPLLHIEQNNHSVRKINSINLNKIKENQKELQKTLLYYENKKAEQSLSEIDERLLFLLNDDIKNCFLQKK